LSQQPNIDPTIISAALASAEVVLNKLLILDHKVQHKLLPLDGQSLLVSVTQPQFNLCIHIEDQRLTLTHRARIEATACLKGTLKHFLMLVKAENKSNALINGELMLTGDTQFVIAFAEILAELNPDIEALISNVTGDALAHGLGRTAREKIKQGKAALNSLTLNFAEFLQEESGMVPSKPEAESQYQQIDKLSMDSERLQARIERLKKSVQKAKGK
jgi:ubiquinone biosynthesis protein UbiJ